MSDRPIKLMRDRDLRTRDHYIQPCPHRDCDGTIQDGCSTCGPHGEAEHWPPDFAAIEAIIRDDVGSWDIEGSLAIAIEIGWRIGAGLDEVTGPADVGRMPNEPDCRACGDVCLTNTGDACPECQP